MNRLFVIDKPKNISSNFYLKRIKWKYKVKKAGFSGTLDPFANGCLITAFGQYTKLFRFLKKTPKTYIATLWLGADSETLDIEKVTSVDIINPIQQERIDSILENLKGELSYLPPKYSAKKINGQRAYKLARNNEEFELNKITSHIYSIKQLHYMHPFLTFEISVSEGSYIRSIGNIIAQKLGIEGILSSLTRVSEGKFRYAYEKDLNPLEYLNTHKNSYTNDISNMLLGKKLIVDDFEIQDDGVYHLVNENNLAIVEIKDGIVKYLINNMKLGEEETPFLRGTK